ncbi:MAG: RNA 2'-phosphotransferase [Planctomycetaceae bacterium]|nr:RNA 2'-phosphotransferase [Planctomycetaceae bacterium]
MNVAQVPPNVLYHGTTQHRLPGIREFGLLPQFRQHVHLTSDEPYARAVAVTHSEQAPVLLVVRAQDAHKQGTAFFSSNEIIWCTTTVPPEFIAETQW